jgi:N-acetyl-anhydromuramyl-L-alanine amidase AmpD
MINSTFCNNLHKVINILFIFVQNITNMEIIKAHIPKGQYFEEEVQKTNIVLHHTVSSTAQSALKWWAIDPVRIATAYIIDKDGKVYEAFPPKYWAHHLGLKEDRNKVLNQRSIGIELVNEGLLHYQPANGGYKWFVTPQKPLGSNYTGKTVERMWRGYQHWAAYTDEQYTALNELLQFLLAEHKLPPTMCNTRELNKSAPDKFTIYSHYHVRADKTDPSPALDYSRIILEPSPVV